MFVPGDVVLVDFVGVHGSKIRPAIVVSSDSYLRTRPDVTVAICTSNTADASTSMDYVLQDWQAAGLRRPTAYRSFFGTYPFQAILRVVGHLTDRDWQEVQARLRLAIAV
jgi:mRNA interferase MazF